MTINNEIEELTRRARSCVETNDLPAATSLYQRLCEIDPGNASAWLMLGSMHAQTANPAGAEACYRKVIALDPAHADATNRLGSVLLAQKQPLEAEKYCRRALDINPGGAEIHATMGNVLAAMNRYDDAAACFTRAVELAPDFVGAWLNLGNALKGLQEYERAIEAYRKVLQLQPQYTDIYNAIGICMLESGRLDEALECYQNILDRQPDNMPALMNMGFIHGEMVNYPEALECYRRVLDINPGSADALLSRGLIEKKLGKFGDAISSYRRALELQPENADARLSLALVELLMANYDDGWRCYTARKSVRDKQIDRPRLLENNLHGQRILIAPDQGIGDELFFLRFVPELVERGARVVCQTDPKIVSMVQRLSFLDEVTSIDEPAPEFDLRLSAGDLPYCLGYDNHKALPCPVSLLPDASRLDEIRDVLSAIAPGPYIGVTWWAGTKHQGQRLDERLAYREIPLEQIAGVLRDTASTVLVLQRNPDDAEIVHMADLLGRPVYDLSRFNDDLEGMLALLYLLDDYIGVDNTNMHLCASIGKICRIFVPYPPEWRMGVSGDSSPWFPGSVLYRQSIDGDWIEAVNQLSADLAADG